MAHLDDLNRDPVVHTWTYKSTRPRSRESVLGNLGNRTVRLSIRLLACDITGRVVVTNYINHANASAGLCLATADILGILPDHLGEMTTIRFVGRRRAPWRLIPASVSIIQVIMVPLF